MPSRVAVNEFVKADKSQDGVLNKQEFEHWLTTTLEELQPVHLKLSGRQRGVTNEVTRDQLKKLAVMSAIPFVGFDFGQCCYDHCGSKLIQHFPHLESVRWQLQGLKYCLGRRGHQSWRFYRDGSVS